MDFHNALPIGGLLVGDYRITSVLGQGGFGLTYRAQDTRLGAPVAVKEYFPSDVALRDQGVTVRAKSGNEESVFSWGRAKFLEEARTLARFRHPNIVRVARLFEANNTAYMVLDFEQGPSLSEWRTNLGRPPTQAELDRIASALLGAVAAVHAAGILHRDIKPQNVIMRGGTEPVLIDFGAARQALGNRSKTVHAIVTPGYSPMEQYAVDVDKQGPWTDIYALGATFAYLVAGKAPNDALSRSLQVTTTMASEARGAYRESFLAAIDAALQLRAQDRPQSVAAWREMLLGGANAAGNEAATQLGPSAGAKPDAARNRQTAAVTLAARSAGPAAGDAGTGVGGVLAPAASSQTVRIAAIGGLVALVLLIGGFLLFKHTSGGGEEAAWQSAISQNSPAAYEAYLRSYPNGRFAADARTRIAATRTPQTSGATPPPTPAAPLPVAEAPLPVRETLPAALTQAEIDSLQAAARPSDFRLGRLAFVDDTRGFSEQAVDFSLEVDRLSGGKVKFAVLGRNDTPRNLDPARDLAGQPDMAVWHSPAQRFRRQQAYLIYNGAVPFGISNADHVRWLRAEGARGLEALYWRDGNVRVIPCGIADSLGFWSRRDIKTTEDLKGLKVIGSPLALDALRLQGATPVNVDTSRLASALGRSEVDAVWFASAQNRAFFATPPPLPFFFANNILSPHYLFELIIAAPRWIEIGEPAQRLIDEACRRNLDKWVQASRPASDEVIGLVRAHPGVAVRQIPLPLLVALRSAANQALDEQAKRDAVFRDTLASYNRFRR